jgi:delta-1-pyrroline-5-carboxylate synthetase
VCVKAGTSVVANEDGRPSLTRLGAIAEQIAELNASGVQVILVSSGAVGMGKRLLRKQTKMTMSFKEIQDGRGTHDDGTGGPNTSPYYAGKGVVSGDTFMDRSKSFVSLLDLSERRPHTPAEKKKFYDSACAAAGQFEMMNLYNALFAQCDVAASQILVTQSDFQDAQRLNNLKYAVDRLLSLGIVPIINENDAVSANQGYTADHVFSDNDSLAALCARSFGAEVLLLLTDVKGVYDRPPTDPNAKLLSLYKSDSAVSIGEKSAQGRGGMQSKIDAAQSAVQTGSPCSACVIAAGHDLNSIRNILGSRRHLDEPSSSSSSPPPVGTLFCTPGSDLEKQAALDAALDGPGPAGTTSDGTSSSPPQASEAREKATLARTQARILQAAPYSVRQSILTAVADALLDRKDEILIANAIDVEEAVKSGVAPALQKRLGLTEEKLRTLASGLRQLVGLPDPLGVTKCKRELAKDLELEQITVPIGVLMIIFESRPDSMPQIAALALASGNGLLLKGGKEANASNAAIHKVLGDAIEAGSGGLIKRDIVALVTSRSEIRDMLSLDDVIDLIIPRGSNALVSYIKSNTRIPVLGHADGVCHVYVDESADAASSCQIVVDAKTDYPSACNAMETLLLHERTIQNGVAAATLMALRAAGVKCLGGPRAMKMGLCDIPAPELKFEYGDLTCMVEVVPDLDHAVDWIHAYGSGHTECIVCSEDSPAGEEFLRKVDAACVFKNASTRFADGFRFGLGAEVGISTGRIHARGPVGVEGLLSTKWQLRSVKGVQCVAEFAGDNPKKTYTHKDLK